MPIELLTCPIPDCPWTHKVPELSPGAASPDALAGVFGPGVFAAAAAHQHARGLEDALRAHFETHTLVDWVTALRNANQRRDALWRKAVTEHMGPATLGTISHMVSILEAEPAIRAYREDGT